MATRFVLLAAAIGLATPALASDPKPHFGSAEWQRRGCTLQQVHTPAGKPVQSPHIVRCKADARVARQDAAPASQKLARN